MGMAGQYLPKFLGGSKALKKLNDVWGVTDSSVLRANMKNAGRTVPKFPNAAHHIVPGAANDRNAMIARTHLAKLGFNANDEINGVFLEFRKKGVEQLGKGAIHNDIHTATYYNEVRKRVTKATSKKAAEKVLRKIAKELENNTFPY
ncbi:Rhs family protein-like protein [Crocosphaera watsonii WH 0005]|uniref:Rhs family protein-like protein n=1 Tax=Crocosphaera watsonii WH 0005 TaxID=423472 RepID=T2IX06_CROWT|nr:Rhs family protein-like protein [Crocosphaera watsonii WH 0005]